MNILVTGSAGYIGSYLCLKLRQNGHKVTGLDNFMYRQANLDNETYNVDIRDTWEVRKLLVKADAVIWLAAIVGMPACKRLPKDALTTNWEALANIIPCLSPSQRIIYPNSNSSYGIGGDVALTETAPFHPLSLYAQTKLDGEKEVLNHPNSVVFRLATVMGLSPRMRLDLLVNNLTYIAYFDKKIELFEGHFRRNYVHVDDVCRIMMETLEREDMAGQIYNLGNDKANCTKKELIDLIRMYLDFEIVPSNKSDSDQRDYIVSSQKLADKGLTAKIGVGETICDLITYYKTFPKCEAERLMYTMSMKNA